MSIFSQKTELAQPSGFVQTLAFPFDPNTSLNLKICLLFRNLKYDLPSSTTFTLLSIASKYTLNVVDSIKICLIYLIGNSELADRLGGHLVY